MMINYNMMYIWCIYDVYMMYIYMYIVDRIYRIYMGSSTYLELGTTRRLVEKRTSDSLGCQLWKLLGLKPVEGSTFLGLRWWSLKQWLARALWHLSANICDFDRFWPLLQHTVAMGHSHCLNVSNITNIYQCILDDFLKTHRPSPKKTHQSTQCQQWQIILAKHYYSKPSPSLP